MANSQYEYVKRGFEFDRCLPASNWIVVRIDGCHFHRFSKIHDFEKPNDENALRLMNACATSMLEKFRDIVFAYGVSDEYSFIFREGTEFYQRRESKILSLCVSFFTSVYVMKWKDFFPNKELREPPYFDGRVVCYPNLITIRDYLAWRQVDCHINNQYNTCFWMLVKSGKTEKEAQQTLMGTFSKDKNELLLQKFQINYDDEPAIFRKGSCVYGDKVETKVKTDDRGNPITRTRLVILVENVDITGPQFWEKHQNILNEGKCGYELEKKFDTIHRLPCCNWIIVCINACQFDLFSLIHTLDKPNDENSLRLMNASASRVMERFPDIIFGYGFSSECSFVFHKKTELYQRQERLILSSCLSYFTSVYMMMWKELFPKKELLQAPHFEAEIQCYPKEKIICEYLLLRQAECHRSNQYNTCFWMLVKSGKGKNKAHEILKGTLSKDMNELLFQRFQMNYNNEPAMFRKGSCAYRQKVEEFTKVDDSENVTRERRDVTVAHVDMKPAFWRKHHYIFNECHLSRLTSSSHQCCQIAMALERVSTGGSVPFHPVCPCQHERKPELSKGYLEFWMSSHRSSSTGSVYMSFVGHFQAGLWRITFKNELGDDDAIAMDTPYPPARQACSSKPTVAPLLSPGRGSKQGIVPSHAASLSRDGAPHDAGALRAVLKRLATASSAPRDAAAPALHAHAVKLGLDRRHRGVRDALVALYLASGRRGIARALFAGAGGGPALDVVSWTSMVTGHARLGMFHEAAALFLAMADDGVVVVDAVAAAAAFAACAGAGDLAVAREVHRRVLIAGVDLDVVACNALVDMYAKCGDVAAALRCFRAMEPDNNVVSWNTMIFAHARSSEPREALSLFREMLEQQQQGARPDDATFVAVLGACAQLGALDAGMWAHAHYVRRTGRKATTDGVVGNALLDMYAKCGAVEQAAEVFDAMALRDVYTYTSMISGLAAHGRGEDALTLFADMRRAGVRPNKVTFLGVLSACCHAGLVEDGLRHFNAMTEVHGVAPSIEHYGCVVDMLGRAGRLDEAEELVATMPVQPDGPIWGSLLSACRAHGHVERAERVMRRMAGEEVDAGDYVLMSNMYAREGRHGKAVRIRREMRRSNVDKVPGCSLIEIDGVVHEFQAVPANSVELPGEASFFFTDWVSCLH